MNEKTRLCTFKLTHKGAEQPGFFHQFGQDIAPDTGHAHTVAIVEDNDGKIHLVYPEFIQFKDQK